MPSQHVNFYEMPGDSGELWEQRRKQKWCLSGISDRAIALNYAVITLPLYLSTESLFRQDIQQQHIGDDLYHFDVLYGPVPRFPGTWHIAFDTTGGTIHWNYSLECVKAYVPDSFGEAPFTPADKQALENELAKETAIGLRDNMVIEGTDRIIPVQKRTYTYNHARGIVTEAYMDYLEALTGVVNANPWHNRAAGEVLFLGARGQTEGQLPAECSVSYEMLYSRNVTNMTLGNHSWDRMTGIDKKGHHYLDVIFMEQDNPTIGQAGVAINTVRIHRLYEELDFQTYLGF